MRSEVVKYRTQDQEVPGSISGKVFFLILLYNIDCGLSLSIFILSLFQISMKFV